MTRGISQWAAALALISTAACAGLGGDEGGGDHLPNRGIIPYERVGDDDAPYVVAPPTAPALRLEHPTALIANDGAIHLYAARVDPQGARAPDIVRIRGDAAGTDFADAEPVLADRTAPGVTRGPDGRIWLASVSTDGRRLHLDVSTDGLAFSPVGDGLAVDGADARFEGPSLLVDDSDVRVYLGRRPSADAPPAIWRARASLSGAFDAPSMVLDAGVDCLDAQAEVTECFDADGTTDPEVRLSTTASGRTLVRLFYVGIQGSDSAIGFAASDDGLTFSRYAFNPVIDSRFDEGSPTNLRVGDRYLLYYSESRSVIDAGVALGVNAPDASSETF